MCYEWTMGLLFIYVSKDYHTLGYSELDEVIMSAYRCLQNVEENGKWLSRVQCIFEDGFENIHQKLMRNKL